MKTEITQNKKAFEPIEVKITIESLDELIDLVTRLKLSIITINDCSNCPYGKLKDSRVSYGLWKLLDNLYAKQFSK